MKRLTLLLSISVAAYVGVYFLVLSLPARVRFPQLSVLRSAEIEPRFVDISGSWQFFPDYHGFPSFVFASVHWLDRTYLRPTRWQGYDPTARTRELDFSALNP